MNPARCTCHIEGSISSGVCLLREQVQSRAVATLDEVEPASLSSGIIRAFTQQEPAVWCQTHANVTKGSWEVVLLLGRGLLLQHACVSKYTIVTKEFYISILRRWETDSKKCLKKNLQPKLQRFFWNIRKVLIKIVV